MLRRDQMIEQRWLERFEREVASIACACEVSWFSDKRPRDDAPDAESASDELECNSTLSIQLVDGYDGFVRRDLKHAVRRRVDDRRAGPHVLRPKRIDDHRSGRRDVALRCPPNPSLELANDLLWESVGKSWKWLIEHDAHHFP